MTLRKRLACSMLFGAVACSSREPGPAASPPPASARSSQLEADAWTAFEARRLEHLRALASPIEACVTRHDTTHPAFHGCYDWHSSVHGTWALLTIARLTNEPTLAAKVDDELTPSALRGVEQELAQGRLDHENPYGYAWFLTLAREREGQGNADLRPLADTLAARLVAWAEGLSSKAQLEAALAPDYDNLSWALLNLAQWASHTGDETLRARVTALAGVLHRPAVERRCGDAALAETSNFFAPCLLRAYALTTIEPAKKAERWVSQQAAVALAIEPVETFPRAHVAGLPFSRSWGLWALYHQTGDARLRARFAEWVGGHMAKPEYWREDYARHAHWVAQFGVYATAMTFERPDPEK